MDAPTFLGYVVGWKVLTAYYARRGLLGLPESDQREPVLCSASLMDYSFAPVGVKFAGMSPAGGGIPARCDHGLSPHPRPDGGDERGVRLAEEHDAPDERCKCGYGMWHDPKKAISWGYIGATPPLALAVVRAWGEIICYDDTARCEHMEPLVTVRPKGMPNRSSAYYRQAHAVEGVPCVPYDEALRVAEAAGTSLLGWEGS